MTATSSRRNRFVPSFSSRGGITATGTVIIMAILTDPEKTSAAAEVRELITASGQEAALLRKQPDESLYGNDDGAFGEVCRFPLEFSETPQEYLAKAIDGSACVLPDLDARVEDRVRFAGVDYRVQTVAEQSLFGVITHKVLELVKVHGG